MPQWLNGRAAHLSSVNKTHYKLNWLLWLNLTVYHMHNEQVAGSIPAWGSKYFSSGFNVDLRRGLRENKILKTRT